MEWRSVIGFHGQYEVSDSGVIRRVGNGRGSVSGRVLTQSDHAQGYKVVSLWVSNKSSTQLAHRVIAAAFLGKCPEGYDVNHKDGNKHNNAVSNLEYVTRAQNIRHAINTGLMSVTGINNPASKLNEQQVRDIRAMHEQGSGYKSLGKLFDVSPETVRDIVKGRIWRHLLGKIE